MNATEKNKSSLKKIVRRALIALAILVLVLIVIAAGVFVWAYTSTDTSLVARGIMWGDSDAGDLYRFPTRQVRGGMNPVVFEPVSEDLLSQLPVSDEAIQAVNMPFETYLEKTNTTAFIALHGDQLLYEGYFNGSSRETIQGSFSAAKSFASTLVGLAIEEGFIRNLDDPITDYLPELLDRDARFKEITIRHLIMMTSGLRWERSDSNPFSDDFITYYSPDLRETALESEIVEAPGQRFLYNDYNPLLVGMILERATGMSVSEYMETRLWGPMGAEGDGSWSLDSERSRFEKMFVGVNGRAIDLVKLGWLFLNDGKNGDTQVVPASWVEQTTRASDAIFTDRGDSANYYQNYWWLDVENEAYYAEGDKCQFIYVYPKAGLVLARFGTDCGGYAFGIHWMRIIAQYLETQGAQ
ncbi:MAG: serine hydrolase [Anaerolineales bacterium]|jgi:CubicO group peptidase (beta-lactamase class C family)